MTDTYDTLVIGGGPAGLSAALHLAWHGRSALVLDRRTGPLFYTLNTLENVPGFAGRTGIQLQQELRRQAEAMGAEVKPANVVRVSGQAGAFVAETEDGSWYAGRTLLLATGVARYHPTVDGDYRPCLAYAGKCNLYYCPDCEAPEIAGKRTLVIGVGKSRGAVGTAKHLYEHSQDLLLLLTGEDDLREADRAWIAARHLPLYQGDIQKLTGHKGCLESVTLNDGTAIAADAFFVAGPKVPRTDLAQQLGLTLAASGHVEPKSQRGDTSVEGVWIAGDLRPMTQQVAIALGTGNIAAVHIDQYLAARVPAPPHQPGL
ncbi:MAG TPA: NAD(P)/FAD-dependent oxidoreductase [Symbiobacteriaceae bacterium]|jgi:thioredoxin reductase (NADPH)